MNVVRPIVHGFDAEAGFGAACGKARDQGRLEQGPAGRPRRDRRPAPARSFLQAVQDPPQEPGPLQDRASRRGRRGHRLGRRRRHRHGRDQHRAAGRGGPHARRVAGNSWIARSSPRKLPPRCSDTAAARSRTTWPETSRFPGSLRLPVVRWRCVKAAGRQARPAGSAALQRPPARSASLASGRATRATKLANSVVVPMAGPLAGCKRPREEMSQAGCLP